MHDLYIEDNKPVNGFKLLKLEQKPKLDGSKRYKAYITLPTHLMDSPHMVYNEFRTLLSQFESKLGEIPFWNK